MQPQKQLLRNRLLSLLPEEDFALLSGHLEPVDLPRAFEIIQPNQVIDHYYFIESGIASVITTSPEGLSAETGLLGRDGITPTAAILHSDRVAHRIVIQVAGFGHRVPSDVLEQALAGSASMRQVFGRFVQTLATQTAYTALSNATHHVEERLARWILMCHDRVDDGKIALTHEFMSVMLAVRRPSVTTALHVLEGNGLIYSDRGLVTVRDRAALEGFASDAYGTPEAEYTRLLAPMGKRADLVAAKIKMIGDVGRGS